MNNKEGIEKMVSDHHQNAECVTHLTDKILVIPVSQQHTQTGRIKCKE